MVYRIALCQRALPMFLCLSLLSSFHRTTPLIPITQWVAVYESRIKHLLHKHLFHPLISKVTVNLNDLGLLASPVNGWVSQGPMEQVEKSEVQSKSIEKASLMNNSNNGGYLHIYTLHLSSCVHVCFPISIWPFPAIELVSNVFWIVNIMPSCNRITSCSLLRLYAEAMRAKYGG